MNEKISSYAITFRFEDLGSVHTKHFHLASFSVTTKTLSALVWTLSFSYRFHEDAAYALSYGSAFDAQRNIVDRRPKRIEMCAVLNENAAVWTGPCSQPLMFVQLMVHEIHGVS